MSESPSRLQRKLISIHDVERYCKPQNLSLYNFEESGFKYNVIGLFGIPDEIDPEQPCVYTVLSSVFPPAEPYKQKPFNSMFAANFFADIDFDRSMNQTQLFKQEDDVELAGVVLRLQEFSVLVFDIKKHDLRTGKVSDYGFAVQPLLHNLKGRNYLIGGRYQVPVYKGSVPKEMRLHKLQNLKQAEQPRTIFKKFVESGKVHQHDTMQIVSQIRDLNPPDPEEEAKAFQAVPSMLHHLDKTELEKFSLEDFFQGYDAMIAYNQEHTRFAP